MSPAIRAQVMALLAHNGVPPEILAELMNERRNIRDQTIQAALPAVLANVLASGDIHTAARRAADMCALVADAVLAERDEHHRYMQPMRRTVAAPE